MKKTMCVVAFLAAASVAMAVIAPISSVTVNNVPGTPRPQYDLLSITVGAFTVNVSGLVTGTSTGVATVGVDAAYNNIANMDNFDLNFFAARDKQNPPEISTVLFGGKGFSNQSVTTPDFFLFEAASGSNPDDVGVAPIFMDDTWGVAVNLLKTGWGSTGLLVSNTVGVNPGQPIVGICWDITDLQDAGGVNLTSSAVIKGIRIMNTTANIQAGNLDPCGLYAVPEPATMIMLGLGGLALLRKRS